MRTMATDYFGYGIIRGDTVTFRTCDAGGNYPPSHLTRGRVVSIAPGQTPSPADAVVTVRANNGQRHIFFASSLTRVDNDE